MKKAQKIIQYAERHCQQRGVRFTEKRKQVLSGLLESNKALSAYELVDYCKNKFNESIPAMSIYRILDFLQQEHFAHKLDLANKYVACAHITCDHTHEIPQFLICSQCQRVKEIVINKFIINKLQLNIEEAGFRLVAPQLEMNCLCKNCSKNAA